MRTSLNAFRFYTLLLLLATCSTSLLAQSVRGSGNVVEQDRNISGFTAIKVSSGVDIHVMQGSADKVVVKTDDNLQEKIKTELNGSVLEISSRGNIRSSKAFDVYITVSQLEKISATAGSDVFSKGTLKVDELELQMAAGSDVELDIEASKLHCKLTAGSDADLSGKVDHLEVLATGGSDLSAKGLKVANCKLRVSGGSDAVVNVSGELDMEATGASDIYYTGGPSVVHSKATGASDIHGN